MKAVNFGLKTMNDNNKNDENVQMARTMVSRSQTQMDNENYQEFGRLNNKKTLGHFNIL